MKWLGRVCDSCLVDKQPCLNVQRIMRLRPKVKELLPKIAEAIISITRVSDQLSITNSTDRVIHTYREQSELLKFNRTPSDRQQTYTRPNNVASTVRPCER